MAAAIHMRPKQLIPMVQPIKTAERTHHDVSFVSSYHKQNRQPMPTLDPAINWKPRYHIDHPLLIDMFEDQTNMVHLQLNGQKRSMLLRRFQIKRKYQVGIISLTL